MITVKHGALITAAFLASSASGLNGSVEMIGEIRVLNLWGTWEEMGYAHGYLMGPDIMLIFEEYFLELAGGQSNVNLLRNYFPIYFSVFGEFAEYAEGIITGASDTISLWSGVYNRNIDILDLYITSSVPDLSAVVDFPHLFCSSVSAWGEATQGESQLQGDPAISRNLDFYLDTGETILDNCILVVHDPDDGQEWVSVSFPGFMGTLSGMNEAGLTAALNMGNHPGASQTVTPFVPICMALALGLSREDFDGSGACDIEDMMASATEWNRANTYDIHMVSPVNLGGEHGPAVVTEVNNHAGFAFRHSFHEPSIAPNTMILTNHHRVLYPPITCYRYSMLRDSLQNSAEVTLDRLWNFMKTVGFTPLPGTGGTLQTMIFQPQQRRIGLAFASSGVGPYHKNPEWIEWTDLFPNHGQQSVQEGWQQQGLSVHPNPASVTVTVHGAMGVPPMLYDLTGRRVDIPFTEEGDLFRGDVSGLATGLYIATTSAGSSGATFMVLR